MGKPLFWCKDCKYVWRTKKDIGRPSSCPRCNSKRIIWDYLTNNRIPLIIGLTGILMFIFSRIKAIGIPNQLGDILGKIGAFFLIFVIIIGIMNHSKNKKILKSIENKN